MTAPASRTHRDMPPDWAAWSFLRARWSMLAAVGATFLLHGALYLLLPGLTVVWREQQPVVYAALLSRVAAAPPKDPSPARSSRPRASKSSPATAPVAVDVGTPADSDLLGERELLNPQHLANAIAAPAIPMPPVVAQSANHPDAVAPEAESQAPFTLPSRVSISYVASSSITDGVAHYTFTREDGRYESQSTLQASGFFVSMFAGVMHQSSRGQINAAGLVPDAFAFRRGNNAPDLAEFKRANSELLLTRGGRERSQPLPAGLQDTQSFVFNLAYQIARQRLPEDPIEVVVTNARKVYRYRFKRIGHETVETRAGPVPVLHLASEAADPEDVYEVWLSPENHYLPVKLRFFAGRFPIELVATSIRSTP